MPAGRKTAGRTRNSAGHARTRSRATTRETAGAKQRKPRPPFPRQHQEKPGIEARMRPRPAYQAPEYRGSGKLENAVALITGGDSGIGRAVAVLYAREGADVAIVHLPQERVDAEETRRAVEAEGRRAELIPGDLTDPEFCREAVERTIEVFGRLTVLVNNAAFQQSQDDLEKITDEQLEHTFATNVFAMFRLTRAALPHMKRGAAIINTASVTALQGSEHLLDYSATKGAIVSFTRSLAQNLIGKQIRVNAVAPGPVWTPLNPSDAPAEKVSTFGEDVPMKRPAQPEEIAPAFVFFASDVDSSYVTGEVLTLLGGETRAA